MTFSRVYQGQKTLKADGQVLTTSGLSALDEKIRRCRKCRLWAGAMNSVPGEGPANAKVMLIGQNPGTEEDKTGKPFVGKSGKFPRHCPREQRDQPRFSVYNKHREAQDSGKPYSPKG